MYDVITMGSNTVDAFANTDAEVIDIRTKDSEEELIAYPLGGKITIEEMRYDVGGNGVNAAVSLSRLGFNTAYLGKVGDDANGREIMKRLEEENIEFVGARGHQSGFSVILDTELDEDRTILTYKGCNNDLTNEEIDYEKINTKWLYLSSMLKDSLESMKHVVGHATHNDIKIAYNPSSTVTKLGSEALREILEATNLLILNDEEAEDLVGKGMVEENLHKLQGYGPETVMITQGAKGLKALHDDKVYTAKPAPNLEVLETTGSGDACASAFLGAKILGKDIKDCIKAGMLNAESVLSHYGAHNKLLNREELGQKLEKDGREITVN